MIIRINANIDILAPLLRRKGKKYNMKCALMLATFTECTWRWRLALAGGYTSALAF